jgi:hypothetical protein
MRARKPIRVFWSPLSRRFFATRAWREVAPGLVECTGERFDVTNDIAGIIERERIEFRQIAVEAGARHNVRLPGDSDGDPAPDRARKA